MRGMFAIPDYMKVLLAVLGTLAVVISPVAAQLGGASSVTNELCTIANDIHSVVFVLALVLLILGGILYAAAHIMPPQQRGGIQGYAFGMIIGGIIGVIIVLIAPWLINQVIAGSGTSVVGTGCTNLGGIFL